MEPIIVRANATAKDINDAHYFHRTETEMVGFGLGIFMFSTFFAAAFFLVTALQRYPFLGSAEDFVHFVFALISPTIPFLMIFLYLKIERSKDFSRENVLFLQPVTYAISEKGLQFIDENITFINEWNLVTHAYDAPEFLFCVLGKTIMVLPKRDFADKFEVDRVRKILQDKVAHFSWTKGKRTKIKYQNSYNFYLQTHPTKSALTPIVGSEETKLIVEPQLNKPDTAQVVLHFQMIAKDQVEAYWKYVAFNSFFSISAISFLFGGILLCVMTRQRNHTLEDEWPFFLVYLILGLCLITFWFVSSKKGLQKVFTEDEKMEVSLSDSSIGIKNASGDLKLVWELLSEFHETEIYYCLIFGSKFLLLIPKAALKDEFKKKYVQNLLNRKTTSFKI